MPEVLIDQLSATWDHVQCDRSVMLELQEKFSFEVPGAKFDKRVKLGIWDGRIKLFDLKTSTIYSGLREQVVEYLEKLNYEVDYTPTRSSDVTLEQVYEFYETLRVPERDLRENQAKCVLDVINNDGRGLILSPTGTGKSLIIYILLKWYEEKTLLMVPRKGLILQMLKDFREYGASEEFLDMVDVVTWQSVHAKLKNKRDKIDLDQYKVVVGDEAHQFQAKCLTQIMELMESTHVRVGTTGTLSESKVHEYVLVGLFGSVIKHITTVEAIERGELSDLKILVLVLEYPEDERKKYFKALQEVEKEEKKKPKEKRNAAAKYGAEVNFIVDNDLRNDYIENLSLDLALRHGNVVTLFERVEDHGRKIKDSLDELCVAEGVPFYYVDGGVGDDAREDIRTSIIENERSVTLASFGTFSTGINIPNLHRLVLASPGKALIRLLQSIGRGLRLHESKDEFVLIDIADDLRKGTKLNYGWKHLTERLRIYASQGFSYKILKVEL